MASMKKALYDGLQRAANLLKAIQAECGNFESGPDRKKVGFTSFFQRFAGSDVLIQCMSTTTHSHSNQTFYWSNVAL